MPSLSGMSSVSQPETSTIDVNGFATRVWRKGSGPRIGFPGGDRGHSVLDTHLDWVLAVAAIIDKAGLAGSDLVGSSIGASFAAETAAIWPEKVKRLALIAPFGLFDADEPA